MSTRPIYIFKLRCCRSKILSCQTKLIHHYIELSKCKFGTEKYSKHFEQITFLSSNISVLFTEIEEIIEDFIKKETDSTLALDMA